MTKQTYYEAGCEEYEFRALDGTFSIVSHFGDTVTISGYYGIICRCTYSYFDALIEQLNEYANEATVQQLYNYFYIKE